MISILTSMEVRLRSIEDKKYLIEQMCQCGYASEEEDFWDTNL